MECWQNDDIFVLLKFLRRTTVHSELYLLVDNCLIVEVSMGIKSAVYYIIMFMMSLSRV